MSHGVISPKNNKTEKQNKLYDFEVCDTKRNLEKSLQYIKENHEDFEQQYYENLEGSTV